MRLVLSSHSYSEIELFLYLRFLQILVLNFPDWSATRVLLAILINLLLRLSPALEIFQNISIITSPARTSKRQFPVPTANYLRTLLPADRPGAERENKQNKEIKWTSHLTPRLGGSSRLQQVNQWRVKRRRHYRLVEYPAMTGPNTQYLTLTWLPHAITESRHWEPFITNYTPPLPLHCQDLPSYL